MVISWLCDCRLRLEILPSLTVEIKSTWTYNKNGNDKELELENETKWNAVKDSGDKLVVLFSKKETKHFIEKLFG